MSKILTAFVFHKGKIPYGVSSQSTEFPWILATFSNPVTKKYQAWLKINFYVNNEQITYCGKT